METHNCNLLINNEIIPMLIEIIVNKFDFENGCFQQLRWMQRLCKGKNVLLGCFQNKFTSLNHGVEWPPRLT